jgi:hypothetical protein
MRRSEKVEWFLRVIVFGCAVAVGSLGALGIWQSLHDAGALLLFVFLFAFLLVALVYIVKRRDLGMLETR